MDVSILPGLSKDAKPNKRKKRRIPYRKPRSIAARNSGVLNKSSCWSNAKKKDESCILNESQLVSIKNISSFLKKNRELAKSLEEAECQQALLQKELTSTNAEVMRMKEEVVGAHSRLLLCKCQTGCVAPDSDTLLQMKKLLLTCSELVDCHIMTMFSENYADAKASTSQKINDAQVLVKAISGLTSTQKDVNTNLDERESERRSTTVCVDKSTQSTRVDTEEAQVQCDIKPHCRNKKVQVLLTPPSRNVALQCSVGQSLPTQPTAKVLPDCQTIIPSKHCVSQETQTTIVSYSSKETQVASNRNIKLSSSKRIFKPESETSTLTQGRNPLQEVNLNQRANKNDMQDRVGPVSILKKTAPVAPKVSKIGRGKARKQKFRICTDEDLQGLKIDASQTIPKKTVRIHSPAQVREFSEYFDESAPQLRRRTPVSYKEPGGHVYRGDGTTDWSFYNSPARKKKGKKPRSSSKQKRRAIHLEQVIKMVADDLRNSFTAEDLRNSFTTDDLINSFSV